MNISKVQILIMMLIVVLAIVITIPVLDLVSNKYKIDSDRVAKHNKYISDRFEIISRGEGTNSDYPYKMTVFRDRSNGVEYIYYKEDGEDGFFTQLR